MDFGSPPTEDVLRKANPWKITSVGNYYIPAVTLTDDSLHHPIFNLCARSLQWRRTHAHWSLVYLSVIVYRVKPSTDPRPFTFPCLRKEVENATITCPLIALEMYSELSGHVAPLILMSVSVSLPSLTHLHSSPTPYFMFRRPSSSASLN